MPTFRGRQRIHPKQPRVRLDSEAGAALQLRVLQRDGWRCQSCGSLINLQVHHRKFRSHGGNDCEDNLITLCNACHKTLHGQWSRKH